MKGHTPGPWKAIIWGNEQYPYPLSIESEDGSSWIARDGTTSSLDNARLLASAPDLLEAARGAGDLISSNLDGRGKSYPNSVEAASHRADLLRQVGRVLRAATSKATQDETPLGDMEDE